MPEQVSGFFIAPFGIHGEPQGMDRWELEKLSPKWLAICGQQLELNGPSFNAPWNGNLSHIQMRFTDASGVALATLLVRATPAASIALLSGSSPAADADVMKMFVDSLRRVTLLREVAASPDPFQKVFAITERPVMIVVPWPDSKISDQDHALVRELALHSAGAFFSRNWRPSYSVKRRQSAMGASGMAWIT